MVQIYRLLIALLARFVMIAAGVLFLYWASFYLLILADSDSRAVLAQTLPPEASPTKPLIYLGLIGTSLVIVGIVLLVFGVRGLWRRVRTGMPSEEEGRAETTTGRLASAAVFGAGALLGLLKLTLMVYALGGQIALAWTGIETDALVTRKWSGDWAPPGSDRPKSVGYQIAFAFDTPTGRVEQETRISSGLYRSVEQGSTVRVTYAPDNPADFAIEFASVRAIVFNAVIWVGLLSVGLWGVRRNLGSDDDGERTARSGPVPPTAPVPSTRTQGGQGSSVRRQFGQRGV
jgi:hypothetical protein